MFYLAAFLFFALEGFVFAQITLVRNETEFGCIKEGAVLIMTCTVEDDAGTGATVWTGNSSIFNCPDFNTIFNQQVYLIHREFDHPMISNPRVDCTDNVAGIIIEYNGTHYTSKLSVRTTYQMNAGYISCQSYYESEIAGETQILVGVVPASPERIDVLFTNNPKNTFKIDWSMPDTVGGINGYHTEVVGNNCGNCSNFIDSGFKGTELLCSDWVPNEQMCHIKIKTVTSDCGFVSETPASKFIHLRYPSPPVVTKISPTYSIKGYLESLLIVMRLTKGKFDENSLPITYGVYLEDLVHGKVCAVLASAECDVENCNIALNMSKDCSMQKDSLYSIKVFAETVIGRSLSNPLADQIDSRNKFAELKVVTRDTFLLIIIDFTETSETLSTSVHYGSCHAALTFKKQIHGENDSLLSVAISDLNIEQERTCFIATSTTGTIPYPLSIQGEFTAKSNVDCAIPIGIVGGVLMFSLVFNVLSIVGYITLKMKLKSHNLEKEENNNNPVYEVVNNNRDTTSFGSNSRTRITPTLNVEENICYSTNADRPPIDVQENVCYSANTDRQPRA